MPFNEDYNYDQLNRYNDYIFLMAYDEFSNDTKPGPVSSQKWIEAAVDQVAKNIPSEKIVLGLAGYGYDWKRELKLLQMLLIRKLCPQHGKQIQKLYSIRILTICVMIIKISKVFYTM